MEHGKLSEQMLIRCDTLRDIRVAATLKVKELLLSKERPDNGVTDISMMGLSQTGAMGTYTDDKGYVRIITVMFGWWDVERDGMTIIEWNKDLPIIEDK